MQVVNVSFLFQRNAARSALPVLQRVGEEEIEDLSRRVEETLQLSTRNPAVEVVVSSRAQLPMLFADPAIVVNSIVEQDDADESLLVSYQNSEVESITASYLANRKRLVKVRPDLVCTKGPYAGEPCRRSVGCLYPDCKLRPNSLLNACNYRPMYTDFYSGTLC